MQLEVLNQIHRLKLVVCDTMDHWIRESGEELKKVLKRIEMLVINDSEARLLSGYDNIVKAARAILRMGPKTVLIKRGEYGVLQFSDSSVFATPAYPLEEVFDPTGAGDSFAGGLMGHLARTGDASEGGLRRAIVYGSVVASFTVEDFGVKRLTEVSLPLIEERYQRFVQLTDFHS
jgi:sugar/nucleoside kinase (ribokinase family)